MVTVKIECKGTKIFSNKQIFKEEIFNFKVDFTNIGVTPEFCNILCSFYSLARSKK